MTTKKLLFISLIIALLLFILAKADTEAEPKIEDTVCIFEPIPEYEYHIEPPIEDKVVPEPVPEIISLGNFKLTAYCSCSKCCGEWADKRPDGIVYGSIGKELIVGYSIAVDPEVIPYGTVVTINGQEYEAMDCGGAINGNQIDIYFSDHDEALDFGVQYAEVFLNED